jgi:riboflavin kinase/FMN adenylyltransferase
MKLIRGLHNLTPPLPGCVATIGNFDGLHLGHQNIINQVKAVASNMSLPTAVVVFEPQPVEFFAPDRAPRRLARLRDKVIQMQQTGIDYLICLNFNRQLANMSAADFVSQILLERMRVHHLVIGDDFRFGHDRKGDFEYLLQRGRQDGFEVENTHTLMIDNQRVSSTRIRQCLADNDLVAARHLLGRPYSLSGKVAHGRKLGQELGFPTINLRMGRWPIAAHGIFAVLVKGLDNRVLRGVASIGTRPTVKGVGTILEVHILNFSEQIYGRCVEIELLHKLRDEWKFDSLEALTEQIHRDIDDARAFFNQHEIPEKT